MFRIPTIPDGTPGVRDEDALCQDFAPGTPNGSACEGDGHYLCRECLVWKPSYEYRTENVWRRLRFDELPL